MDVELVPVKSGRIQISPSTNRLNKNHLIEINGAINLKTKTMAIEVRNANLKYGRGNNVQLVLNDMQLTVPQSSIYGLLGPSGCGKTTMLNVVVGCSKLDSGRVKVFGEMPGTKFSVVPGRGVGFMPQETALYPEFTIKETLAYFGKLQHMDAKTIKQRTRVLMDILNLPTHSNPIEKLSGGQQRRVSLAVALIHKPPLLILDEPTVGVDPLLRKSIWAHLIGLSKEGMTIVVTTHYIQEAHQCDYVGLMRNGRMLTEESPDALTSRLGEPELESCFLKLCSGMTENESGDSAEAPLLKQTKEVQPNRGVSDETIPSIDKALARPSTCSSKSWSNFAANVLTLFDKNLKRLRRNIILVMFHLIIPCIVIVLTCVCVGPMPNQLQMAVVNQELNADLSVKYLDSIDPNLIIMKSYPDLTTAINEVSEGNVWGVIHVGPDFGDSLIKRLEQGMYATNETIRKSSVNVHLDMTDLQVALCIQKILLEAFQKFASDTVENAGGATNIADYPVTFKTLYGELEPRFMEFLTPGVNVNLAYFLAMALTLLNLVEERKSGLLNRSFVNGVTSVEILIAQLLSQSIILAGQIICLFSFCFLVFQIPLRGPFIWVVVIMLLQGVYGMSFGLFIASIISDENLALMASVGSFYPTLLITGLIWPVESQPTILRYLSKSLPQTIPTDAMRSILSRGWGIEHTVVWSSILIVLGWLVLVLAATAVVLRFKK